MKSFAFILAIASAGVLAPSGFAESTYSLNDWCVSVNGDIGTCNDPTTGLPLTGNGAVDLSGFDATTLAYGSNSLGTITVTLGAGAAQSVAFYADYDILYSNYLSNNDNAWATGSLNSIENYQIGDPSLYTGTSLPSGYTLFDAFANNTLDDSDTLGTPGNDPQCCDVAFALAFNGIDVGDGGAATVTFNISPTQPGDGFYITQASNSGDGGNIFLNGAVNITEGESPAPEPSSFPLGAGALVVVGLVARVKRTRLSRG